MPASQSPEEAVLQESMGRLEAAFLAPVVSGELNSWVENMRHALDEFGPAWVAYVKNVLHPQYAEIAKTDSDLLDRVGKLIQADKELLNEFYSFQERVRELSRRAQQVDKKEYKTVDQREDLEKAGIALTVKIKKQQAAAAVWLNEATYRERGTGD